MMMGQPTAGRERRAGPRDETAEIREQIGSLQQRLADLERGDASVGDVADEVPRMCPMCQQMMEGAERETSRDDLEQRIGRRIRALEERMRTFERRAG
jgi:hypothetical protein